MKFNFNDYRGNYAMHCKTEEESNDFRRVMHEDGRTWFSNRSYLEYNNYNKWRGETCYDFNEGTFYNRNYFEKTNYTILEWSDFMEKKFTKEDLKVGMLVEIINGIMYIVTPENTLSNTTGWINLDVYNDNMKRKNSDFDYLDIIKVWSYPSQNAGFFNYSTENRTLLWEREEEIYEYTIEDIAKLTGKPIENIRIKK